MLKTMILVDRYITLHLQTMPTEINEYNLKYATQKKCTELFGVGILLQDN
jgi:hypothetical protein